jgi:hypothetical protein
MFYRPVFLIELETLAASFAAQVRHKEKHPPMAWTPIFLIAEQRTFAGSAIGHARIAD